MYYTTSSKEAVVSLDALAEKEKKTFTFDVESVATGSQISRWATSLAYNEITRANLDWKVSIMKGHERKEVARAVEQEKKLQHSPINTVGNETVLLPRFKLLRACRFNRFSFCIVSLLIYRYLP